MTNATFHNFTDQPFTGYWNGKPKTFKAGEKQYMPAWLAEHFAKHLTNQVLIANKQEVYCSPKNPGQVPQFMDVFKKAFIPDTNKATANEVDDEIAKALEPAMDIVVEKLQVIDQGPAAALAAEAGDNEPQIINPPAGDDDEFDLPKA